MTSLKTLRNRVRSALPARFDASTMRIHADGLVSARLDPNVVPASQNVPRLNVGTVRQLLGSDE